MNSMQKAMQKAMEESGKNPYSGESLLPQDKKEVDKRIKHGPKVRDIQIDSAKKNNSHAEIPNIQSLKTTSDSSETKPTTKPKRNTKRNHRKRTTASIMECGDNAENLTILEQKRAKIGNTTFTVARVKSKKPAFQIRPQITATTSHNRLTTPVFQSSSKPSQPEYKTVDLRNEIRETPDYLEERIDFDRIRAAIKSEEQAQFDLREKKRRKSEAGNLSIIRASITRLQSGGK